LTGGWRVELPSDALLPQLTVNRFRVKTLQFFSKDTFCSYEIGTIIAVYDFRFNPSTNEASKRIDEGIGR